VKIIRLNFIIGEVYPFNLFCFILSYVIVFLKDLANQLHVV